MRSWRFRRLCTRKPFRLQTDQKDRHMARTKAEMQAEIDRLRTIILRAQGSLGEVVNGCASLEDDIRDGHSRSLEQACGIRESLLRLSNRLSEVANPMDSDKNTRIASESLW